MRKNVSVVQIVCDGCDSMITGNTTSLAGHEVDAQVRKKRFKVRVVVTLPCSRPTAPLCAPCSRYTEMSGGRTDELCEACKHALSGEADLCEHCLTEVLKSAGIQA